MIYPPTDFENIYFKVREKEGRMYSDSELIQLPDISHHHLYYNEWIIRKKSCWHLIQYLGLKNKGLKILEVGCGNGWLSNRLSQIPESQIIGIDPNREEILQARRVFIQSNLQFLNGGLENPEIRGQEFDIIIFAASIQYFPDLKNVVNKSLSLLFPDGEMIILDSPFYSSKDLKEAKARTLEYYSQLGFPEMSDFYFHHRLRELKPFNYTIWYNRHSFWNRIIRKSPFMGISIKKYSPNSTDTI